MKGSVFIARFPYGATDHPDTTDWLVETVVKAKSDPRIHAVYHRRYDDTPIPMTRNKAVRDAQLAGADFLLMLDNDMAPDLKIPGARPFWESSLDFALNSPQPCVIAAPYCGPPPHSNVYIFRWTNQQNPGVSHAPDIKLDQFGREEAAGRMGMEYVAALPTGLILIDMRVFRRLKPPYFYYEWTDASQSEKASTEDVTFTRDCSLAGIPVLVNWDAWAGHWKRIRVDKPIPIYADHVAQKFRDAVLANRRSDERVLVMGDETDIMLEAHQPGCNGHRELASRTV